MTPTIRLLPFAAADGTTNMARDEAMLESAAQSSAHASPGSQRDPGWARGHGIASLRFYTWTEPTLSLGYFQESASRRPANIAWVRRSTGGAGIVHHHELTYSFALPSAPEWKSDESWICRFHYLIRDLLRIHGIASKVVVCGEEQKLGDVLCFLHQTPGDLVINGSKVAGSAQRKMRGALLQHGSILLRASNYAPELRGINDFAGKELFTPESLAALLAKQFASNTGARLDPGEWTAAEQDRIPAIRAAKYANAEWNGKR